MSESLTSREREMLSGILNKILKHLGNVLLKLK